MNRRTLGYTRGLRPPHALFALMMVFVVFCASAGSQQLAKAAKPASNTGNKETQPVKPDDQQPQTQYTVGDGDVLHVNVWQESEVSQNAVVRPDGMISLPLVNEVKVSGMTPLQIQDLIAQKLRAYVNDPKVTITLVEIHSKRAFITGEVTRPGEYSLNTQLTVLQLISQAGGFTPFAKRKSITVLRTMNSKQQSLKFNYEDVVHGKNTDQNVVLQPGDTVVVP